MTKQNRTVAIGAIVFALGAVCAVFLTRDRLVPALQLGAPPTVTLTHSSDYWELYRLTSTLTGRVGSASPFGDQTQEWSDLAGEVNATYAVSQSVANARDLNVEFREPKGFLRLGAADQGLFGALKMTARTDATGIGALGFNPPTTPSERAQARALLALTQVGLPVSPAWAWDVIEETPQGRFAAHYAIKQLSAAQVTVTKTVKGKACDTPNVQPRPSRDGEYTIVIDRSAGRITSLTATVLTKTLRDQTLVGEETTVLRLQFTGTEAVATPVVDAVPLTSSLAGVDEFRMLEEQQLIERLGADTAATLHDVIAAHATWTLQEMQPTYLKLVALLKLQPATARDFLDILITGDTSGIMFGTVATALTKVGSAQAQATLREAIEGITDEEHAMPLVPHLSLTDHPNRETEDFLRRLSETGPPMLAATAALALGSVGHQLRSSEPERARALAQSIAERLGGAALGEDRNIFLSALGNLGVPEQISAIQPFVASADAEVRQRAVNALRFIDTPEAQTILMTRGGSDSDPAVRAKALEALSYTPGTDTTLAFYAGVVKAEADVQTLKEALKNLSVMAKTRPEAAALIEEFIKHCGQVELSAYALGMLKAARAA